MEFDNNWGEQSIKLLNIGHKNWMFANTPRGSQSNTITYSIVETAKENRLNPLKHLTFLFNQLPNVDTKDVMLWIS